MNPNQQNKTEMPVRRPPSTRHYLRDPESIILDPAEYLFKDTSYHDRHFSVGNPSSGTVEEIGVITVYLVSQSSVFRAMLKDSLLADHTGQKTHISDTSPQVFKLMLRFMYGGLMPQMSKDTMADLLLCADKYNVQPLVKWSSKRLIPTTVNELFPAMKCVVYVSLPDLLPHVTKLLQEQTVEVVKCKQFFQLDDKCMEFITKQETLAVTEVQLWRSIMNWVKTMAKDVAKQRRLLTNPLKHVRFLTFTQDEIEKEVLNSNLLSPRQTEQILSAVKICQPIKFPGLCSVKEKRGIIEPVNKPKESTDLEQNADKNPIKEEKGLIEVASEVAETTDLEQVLDVANLTCSYIFNCEFGNSLLQPNQPNDLNYQSHSNFTITCFKKQVCLESFLINTRSIIDENGCPTYNFRCKITVRCYDLCSSIKEVFDIISENNVVSGMGSLVLSLKRNGRPLILAPDTCYNISIHLSKPHPVLNPEGFSFIRYVLNWGDGTHNERSNCYFSVKFLTEHHVKQIKYKIRRRLN